ncbi:hypothetical protein GCM10025868_28840 [Angustibacter aerolatus]|uniref:Uncharacterized protein n=1 Tax=Angustibacter aerolatus TaxID=1162965 RepID=A0ABQ6JKG0_9ACTN|nr:hypothetical protein GCM10025868_28840 [Angustibacter aerolatus]
MSVASICRTLPSLGVDAVAALARGGELALGLGTHPGGLRLRLGDDLGGLLASLLELLRGLRARLAGGALGVLAHPLDAALQRLELGLAGRACAP